MTKANFQKIKKELIKLYEEFLENPLDQDVIDRIIHYSKVFGGLGSYNDYFKSLFVPKNIESALNGLSALYQYGLYENTHEAYSNEKIIA